MDRTCRSDGTQSRPSTDPEVRAGQSGPIVDQENMVLDGIGPPKNSAEEGTEYDRLISTESMRFSHQ
jgi:hypothetical protein